MITYPVPPALFAEMQAAVRHYADTMQVSEAEAWAVLEERIAEELDREWRRFLEAEIRQRWGA